MTEHSPTPWKIYDGADPYHVKIMGPYPDIGGPHIADVSGSANAAMIIQAVNLHDRLVDALKEIHAHTGDPVAKNAAREALVLLENSDG
jgi:hypothetical protein